MAKTLNDAQLEILRLFHHEQSAEEIAEIRSLLVAYLSDKVTREADKDFDSKNHALEVFEQWKSDHFRKSSRQ
jgi:hypothetical protein